MTAQEIFEQILKARGLASENARASFLAPDYQAFKYDPFLLPDMEKAVARIIRAKERGERVVIYGDYDIDGLTATSVLLEALPLFGIDVGAFIPNRFVEGYGLSKHAIHELAEAGAELIITVDCGSLSHAEITLAHELGVDVIVTDHHNVTPEMPPAVAVINPKRTDHSYPFIDLAGVGVAFKLVQALQQKIEGMPDGQEKWLLDLVALGTVCDIVSLVDENRANVFWGLRVMQKTRRPGLLALAAVAGVDITNITARHLGFVLGPHLNAAGRLDTASRSLDVLRAATGSEAMEAAKILREMNLARRAEQDAIFIAAKAQAEQFADDPVLVLSHQEWSHGIIGIVAAKILELYKKPTFILQELSDQAKGSARSFGDFSAADAIRAAEEHIIKGGGHKLAAGVTLEPHKIIDFRRAVNSYYHSLQLQDQSQHLEAKHDITLTMLSGVNEELLRLLAMLEPFGQANNMPVFSFEGLRVVGRREMGADKSHLKLTLSDADNNLLDVVAWGRAKDIPFQPGDTVSVKCTIELNEWNGRRSVQGKLLRIELRDSG
ncbi:MAG TPA: single-stranded-DNA-specific exonuclease RecJ [Candidatus Saccharimonadales bacterium]